ncbi:hypothetical protein E2562_004680 [Oryza meyeriana var. granulata]|uniref:Uncharacterized protein n=1 Tax=Oryza meyeriana var. granulata TaxID=110450 RepID=A0A6G1DDJ4_9ORYZ|nr:hypothetical protein E2562_004680 [Oryza meyeriana var. granulata]
MNRHFLDASLVLPTHGHRPPDEADAPRSSALIDLKAYIADRRDATTACCTNSLQFVGIIQYRIQLQEKT